jgi:hypothetical protein
MRAPLTAGAEFLVARILDLSITRYLRRGTFDLLMHSVSTTYGVLEQARAELPGLFELRARGPSIEAFERINNSRSTTERLRDGAKACVVMLRRVRERLADDDKGPFIDWGAEKAKLRPSQ